MKLDFGFLYSIEYFDGLLYNKAQKCVSVGLQGTLNVRKQTVEITYIRF